MKFLEKHMHRPNLLFRFRSLDPLVKEYTKSAIIKNELFLSHPAGLNDPYDCQIALSTDGTEQEWRQHILRSLKARSNRKLGIVDRIRLAQKVVKEGRHLKISGENFAHITAHFGVACFSGEMNNLLMWSHYANNHRGLCMIFDPERDYNGVISNPFEVVYQRDYPKVRIVDLKKGGDDIVKGLLLKKAVDWQYEKEYRVIVPHGARSKVYYHPASLVGVIMGARASSEDKQEVESWLKQHPYKPILHFAELNHESYGVRFDPQKSR